MKAPPDSDGWHFDVPELPVHIHVSDNSDGTSTSEVTYPDGSIFYVGYGGAQVKAHKRVNGAVLHAGDFNFGLFDEFDRQVGTAKNDKNGDISFPQIHLNAPGIYHYTMREMTASVDAWNCDERIIGVTIIVTGNAESGYNASVSYDTGAEPTVINTYGKRSCSCTVRAKKRVVGGHMCAGMWGFALCVRDGTRISVAANDADGNIRFPGLNYTEPGVYCYTMRELTPSVRGWGCDGKSYGVTVSVTENAQGALTASASYECGAVPMFVNRYRR
jgi:pilin isopeptide linkage protein